MIKGNKNSSTVKPSAKEKVNKGKQEKKLVVKDVKVFDESNKPLKRVSKKEKPRAMVMKNHVSLTSAPARTSASYKCYYETKSTKNGQISRGMDFLGQISSRSTGSQNLIIPGQIMIINNETTDPHSLILTPLSAIFSGTKLGLDALKFEKFRFRKLKFIYCGDVGTSTPGSIILAYDPDAADSVNISPQAGDSALSAMQTLLGFEDQVKGPGWSTFELDCKLISSDPQKFFYTNYVGGDIRLAAQGQLWVANGGAQLDSTDYGTLLIEYDIEFFDTSLANVNSQRNLARPDVPVDTALNHGLNWLLSDVETDETTGEGDQYSINVDEQGNGYINIPPGIHQMIYQSRCASGGTPTAPSMVFGLVQNIVNSGLSAAFDILNTFNSGASSASLSSQIAKISSPPGGCRLYGTVSTTGTVLSSLIKLAQWAAETVI